MLRALTLLVTVLGLLAPPAAAQGQEARATLYTRVEGDEIHAAAVIRISPEWYLYHTDLGHPDAVGTPLSLTFGEEGEGWSEPVLPEPRTGTVDDEYLGEYTYDYHTGRIVLYAVGERDEGASEDDGLKLSGLTCSSVTGTCVPYAETVHSDGPGADRYWEDWPASLGSPPSSPEEPGDTPMPGGEPPKDTPPPSVVGPPVTVDAGQESIQSIFGEEERDEGPVDAHLHVRIDDEKNTAQLAVVLDIAEDHYVYHGPTEDDLGHPDFFGTPTTVEVIDESGAIEWGETRYPEPKRVEATEYSEWYWKHTGEVVLRVDGTIVDDPEGADPRVEVGYQVCDASSCLPPTTVELESSGRGEDGWFETATPVTRGQLDGSGQDEMDLWIFLLSAVGWGIFTLLMPCTYPMIPITISFFTKQADARGGEVLPLSIVYGLGIVAVFILIGVVFGSVIIPFATHPVTNIVIGALFLFFAFVLFGFVKLEPPAALMRLAGKASTVGGYLGVFLMGTTLVVTSFTCTAPFVGALLGSAAIGGDADYFRIVLGMGVFGLTMATPFVFLSLVPGRMRQMPQAGEWMNTLKVFLGFVELAASLKFLSNADVVWNWRILPREVFLLAWFAIFLAAGLYLIGKAVKARREGLSRGTRQIGFGAATVAFALYCGYGVPGNQLDETVMTALVPPYTNADWAEVNPALHEVVVDDWELAKKRALEQDKLVLVNFTGLT